MNDEESKGSGEEPSDQPDITGELEPVDTPVFPTGSKGRQPRRTGPLGAFSRLMAMGFIALLILLTLAANPGNILQIEELAAFALVIFGVVELVATIQKRAGYKGFVQPVAAIIVGVVIWVWPEETLTVVGFLIGGLVIVRGGADIWAAIRGWHEKGANSWVFIRGLILIALGGLVLLIPASAVPVVVVGGALLVITRAAIAIVFVTTTSEDTDVESTDSLAVMTHWLSARQMDAEHIDHIEQTVFLHRGNLKERTWRFAILMALATSIATFGIAVDSTAVVIGAMLVAPLMTPILGVSAGLINGRRKAATTSGVIVAGGAVGAVVLAWALSALIPNLSAVLANSQVTTRTAPSLLDLAIAVAAGIAGAYSVSRAESSDALPGVAVAIALVPPLSVVGITLHGGDVVQAAGATLLFLTNLFSIVLMSGIVFMAVGYGSWTRLYYRRNRIRTAFALVTLAVILITIPLALTGRNLIAETSDLRNASAAVDTWLEEAYPDGDDQPLRINTIEIDGDTVDVQLIGHENPPPSSRLAEIATDLVGRSMSASVRWIEEQIEIGDATQLPLEP
jgi:uncharacterized hydrophobic protein (TIGR00271 family)